MPTTVQVVRAAPIAPTVVQVKRVGSSVQVIRPPAPEPKVLVQRTGPPGKPGDFTQLIADTGAASTTKTRSSQWLVGHLSGVVTPEQFGADPTGATPSTAALTAAVAAFGSTGGTVQLRGGAKYLVDGDVEFGDGVNLLGVAGGQNTPTITMSGTTARIGFTGRGGTSGGFAIKANGAGNPAGVLYLGQTCVGRVFMPIFVDGAAGDGVLIDYAQNCMFANIESTNCAGDDMVIDHGAGGLLFLRTELASAGLSSLHLKAGTGGPYPVPTDIHFVKGIFENYGTTGKNMLQVDAADRVMFDKVLQSAPSVALTDGHCTVINGGSIDMRSCSWNGGNLNGAVEWFSNTGLYVHERATVKNCLYAWTLNGGGFGSITPNITYAGTPTTWNLVNGASLLNIYDDRTVPARRMLDPAKFTWADRWQSPGDTGFRLQITPAGVLQFGDGAGTTGATITPTGADATVSSWRITGRDCITTKAVTQSASGALTLDTSANSAFRITLNAAVTGTTLSNPKTDQVVRLTVVPGTSTSFTWPGNAKFDGDTAPAIPAAGKELNVMFYYDGGNARWKELHRSTVSTT